MNTLHPGIHAGFLADIHNEKHVEQIKNMSIHPIEVLIVNLYPFLWKVRLELNKDKILEFMDIGTPVLLRAAARNYRNVVAISDISEYEKIISKWEGGKGGRRVMCSGNLGISMVFTHSRHFLH